MHAAQGLVLFVEVPADDQIGQGQVRGNLLIVQKPDEIVVPRQHVTVFGDVDGKRRRAGVADAEDGEADPSIGRRLRVGEGAVHGDDQPSLRRHVTAVPFDEHAGRWPGVGCVEDQGAAVDEMAGDRGCARPCSTCDPHHQPLVWQLGEIQLIGGAGPAEPDRQFPAQVDATVAPPPIGFRERGRAGRR